MINIQKSSKNKPSKYKKIKNKRFKAISRMNIELMIAPFLSLIAATIITFLLIMGLYAVLMWSNKDTIQSLMDEPILILDEVEAFIIEEGVSPEDLSPLINYLEKYEDYIFEISAGSEVDVIKSIYEKVNLADNSISVSASYANGGQKDYEHVASGSATERAWRIISNDQGLFIITTQYKAFMKISDRMDWIGGITFIVLFLFFFISFINRKRKQLIIISHGLDRLSGGELDYQIKVKGKDEIATVANHINEMSHALKTRIDNEQHIEKTKNELIANVSHDIRTPLTSITGYLGLLKEGTIKSEEQRQDYIERCYNKVNNLNHLVDQLFDYVLLSNHQLTIKTERTDMNVFIGQMANELSSYLESSGYQLNICLLEQSVYADIDTAQWVRVFENLMSNILKYGDSSEDVLVQLSLINSKLVIELINKIKPDIEIDEAHVFERYFTSKREEDKKDKSVGLGLAICKQIIEQHQGTIELHIVDQHCVVSISTPIETKEQ